MYAKVVPVLDEKELEKTVNPIVQEYFEHGDTKEVQVNGVFDQSRYPQVMHCLQPCYQDQSLFEATPSPCLCVQPRFMFPSVSPRCC